MTLGTVPLRRAYNQLLDLARADGYGGRPQLFALTWLAAARMVIDARHGSGTLEALAEPSSWEQLAAAGFPPEAIELSGAFRGQNIGRRAYAAAVVADLHRAVGESHWDVLPFVVDAPLMRPYGADLGVLPPLASYLLDLVGEPKKGGELWIPFDELGQLTIEAVRRGWTVRTASPLVTSQLPLELLLIIETGRAEHPRVLRDVQRSISGIPSTTASHVLAMPPFGMPLRNSRLLDWDTAGGIQQFAKTDSWVVHEFLSRATERAVFVVSQGVLFSRGQEERLRELLLQRGGEKSELAAVIALPTGFLAASPAIGGAALILTPGRGNDEVIMVDLGSGRRSPTDADEILRQEHRHLNEGTPSTARKVAVTRDEIEANDYSFAPSRYLRRVSDLGESTKLGNVCEAIRPPSPAKDETGFTAYEVGPGDLNTWRPLAVRGKRFVHLRSKPKQEALLRPGDLVVSIKGTVGKAALVGSIADSEPLVPSQSCLALRVPDGRLSGYFTPEYLLMYLRSQHGQAQLAGLQVGTGVQHVSPATLLGASVPVPSPEEYVQVRRDFDELCRLEEQQGRLAEQMDQIRQRHWALGDDR
jgi:hypothetical protein